MSEPILITGAAGFVGAHLVEALDSETVVFEGDVTDPAGVRQAVRTAHPAAVIHLAARSSVAESWGATSDVWHVNVVGTANVLTAVRSEQPDARVLVASSGEVYGRASVIPTPEDAPVAPLSPYGASKAAAEVACGQAARSGLDVIVVRPFPHVGPGQHTRFAVSSWAAQIVDAERSGTGTIRVGDLSACRDLLDVRDVVAAYRGLLDRSVPAGTYNIASGAPVTMREVLDALVSCSGVPLEIVGDPDRLRPVEVPRLSGDPGRLRNATGWGPQIPLEQTLTDTLDSARRLADEATVTR